MQVVSDESGQMPSTGLLRLQEHAKIFATAAKSKRTRQAYTQQWARFQEWCRDHCVIDRPIEVTSFIAHLAEEGIRPSSIDLALVAISSTRL